ncbi:hypothetical protein LAZ67_3003940 [Cordylochernes scorpioides]|uniref:Reverse transcriptase domain-containing protein n=1 Tax=Cordylochernes scorpioides TaxID=51811 RepID=A0ABY6K8Y7_9ARAC|nr:hypothetical protein LAZ67_3003940 [Cordylochernes scorpioides]
MARDGLGILCEEYQKAKAVCILGPMTESMSTFTFDTQFFKQTKGSPMGSPLSTVVAEVVMRSLDQWITSRHSADIFLWRRYIDDTFCLVSEVSASHILSDLNSFHPDIAFTHETENHSVLPFLDTLVIRTPSKMADLLQSITRDIRHQKNDITQRHNSKLHHWIKKYNFPAYLVESYLPQSPQGVVNLSDYVLPSADAEILSLGLKYRPPWPSDIPRILAGVEPALRGLNHQDTHRIRHFVTSTLQRPYNIPKPSLAMNRVISRLKRNRDIVITKSDKGSQTVILNTTVYKQKMQNVLDQHSIFSAITEQDHKTSVRNFRLLLLRLKRSQQITKEQYNDFTANLAQIAYIYGLPKIHKPDVPLRPIISYHLSPAYTLSKFLSNFLTPLLQSPPWEYTIANSPSFVSYITSLTPPPRSIMVSFDTVVELTSICLGMSTFTFDTQFFKQTKGSPMGSPLSTVVAEVVMRSLDQWITSRHSADIFLWRRYIDDTFCLVSEVSASHILSDLNSFHPDIAFTHETENHSVLPFLDTLVIRTPSSFHTTIFPSCEFSPFWWCGLFRLLRPMQCHLCRGDG